MPIDRQQVISFADQAQRWREFARTITDVNAKAEATSSDIPEWHSEHPEEEARIAECVDGAEAILCAALAGKPLVEIQELQIDFVLAQLKYVQTTKSHVQRRCDDLYKIFVRDHPRAEE